MSEDDLVVYRWVQLVLPWVQTMQDLASEIGHPPHTTSLPPDWRERLWWDRGLGNSGTEHVSEEGGGKISTVLEPPTTSCPEAKFVKDNVTLRGKKHQTTKMRNLSVH